MNALQRWNQEIQYFESMMVEIPKGYVDAEPPVPLRRGCIFCDEDGPFDLVRPLPNGDTFTLYVCNDHKKPPEA